MDKKVDLILSAVIFLSSLMILVFYINSNSITGNYILEFNKTTNPISFVFLMALIVIVFVIYQFKKI